ncbi:MAG: hypothetical protein LC778_15035 [Acidobacteria bacterium]|nr:hypothetical protein [Acidobacteriota bacterium]
MSKRSKNNSIIFLTTLSVYLGLVLVGAPPSADPSADKYLTKIIEGNFSQKFEPKAFPLADYPRPSAKQIKLSLQANETDLSLKISFGKTNAEQFAEFLSQEFSSASITVKDALTKQIYENTSVSSENNQVFIVIRLPRGSLDALLTDSAK